MPLKFETAASVESVCWELRTAEWLRSQDRARINRLFNGAPPYSETEMQDNGWSTNVNDLSASVINASARRQIWNALCTPNPIFSVGLDSGPAYKRMEWAQSITKWINKPIMANRQFLELRDSVGAQVVLHGISPTMWEDDQKWLQQEIGIEDVLVPSNTYRSLRNLPFIAIYRQYSANQLHDLTSGPYVDKSWNMDLVKASLDWVDTQANAMLGQNWPAMWLPEKAEERWKGDSGAYAAGAVPTIDAFDFFYYSDDDRNSGWKRRIILDAWGQPGPQMSPDQMSPSSRRFEFSKDKFLYDSGDRIYSDDLNKFIHFQFGDASAVAPFRYHSVRSMGFLLYSVCHLQNRLKCKLSDAAFESMMQYFTIGNPQDADRLQKVDLIDKGFIPEGLSFVPPANRWQVNKELVESQIDMNRQAMSDVSTAFSQNMEESQADETATLTMARVNSTAALVGSMLNRIYAYEQIRYQEICRRFCIVNSKDLDVKQFRLNCLKDGVPEEMLDIKKWNITLTKVIGGGHKMMQVAIVDKLMQTRPLHGPEAQAKILKLYDATITDDWSLAEDLNPDQPHVSDSVHDSELAFGTLMQGSAVTPRPGLNASEVVQTMLQLIGAKVGQINKSGGVGTPQDLTGLQAAIQYTAAFIQQLAQDPDMKQQVKQFGDLLGQATNEIKAFGQRQQEAAQAAQEQQGQQQDPQAQAKAQATVIQAQTKAKIASESHAQKQAQKQLSFEAQQKQNAEKAQASIALELARHEAEMVKLKSEHERGTAMDVASHSADLAKKGLEAKQNQEINKAKKKVAKKPKQE